MLLFLGLLFGYLQLGGFVCYVVWCALVFVDFMLLAVFVVCFWLGLFVVLFDFFGYCDIVLVCF